MEISRQDQRGAKEYPEIKRFCVKYHADNRDDRQAQEIDRHHDGRGRENERFGIVSVRVRILVAIAEPAKPIVASAAIITLGSTLLASGRATKRGGGVKKKRQADGTCRLCCEKLLVCQKSNPMRRLVPTIVLPLNEYQRPFIDWSPSLPTVIPPLIVMLSSAY